MSFQNEIWFAIAHAADNDGTGTPADPFIVHTPETFANRMRLSTGTSKLVRLGPGIFRTRGVPQTSYFPIDPLKIWRPQSGQKIIGSGIFATTLQLVWDWDIPTTWVDDEPPQYHAGQRAAIIANAPNASVDTVEISDLTLDCNLQHIPEPFGPTLESGTVTASTSGAEAVRFANCDSRKFFNNQNTAGQLLRGFDGTNYVLELEDREEDVLLAM
jgi:hypothetical protein